MGWKKNIIVFNEIHSVAKAYVNIVNVISTFTKPNPKDNIITNDTILTQYIIKKGLSVFVNKGEAAVQKELNQFHSLRVVDPNKPQDLSYEHQERIL